MYKAITTRVWGNRGRLLLACALLCMALSAACTPESDKPKAQAETAADILSLVERGAYEEADAALRDSGTLTDAERAMLGRAMAYHRGLDAEAAGDDATAYARYRESGGYADAQERMTHCHARLELVSARALFDAGDIYGAFAALDALGGVSEAEEARLAWEAEKPDKLMQLHLRARDRLGAGAWYTAAAGQTPLCAGDARYDLTALPRDADAVHAGMVGMLYRKDGALTAYGDGFGKKAEIEALTGVVDAAAGVSHVIAALDDGSVRVIGNTTNGRGAADDWTGIAAVAAGAFHSVGMTADGACVAAGDNFYGQCSVQGWSGLTDVAAGLHHTVGLKADGTCVATGDNTYGQCDVSGWKNVLGVYCGANHTVALTREFTLLAAGSNAAGQCGVSGWTDIVAVACGAWHTVGVRADGQAVFCGADTNGQADLAAWRLFDGVTGGPAPFPAAADGPVDELVCWGDAAYGPWLYLYPTGMVCISYDEATQDKVVRADLYAAAGSQWYGVVREQKVRKKPVAARQLARENRMVIGITGDFLDGRANPPGIKIRLGEVYDDHEPITGFYLDEAGRMVFVDPTALDARDLLDAGVVDCWTFGPALLENGEKVDISRNYFRTYPSFRCILATVDAYHNLVLTTGYGRDDGIYLSEAQDILLGYGATDAYNMDGGYSTALVFMGEVVNHSNQCRGFKGRGIRSIIDLVGFLRSDAVPSPDDPYALGEHPVKRRE